MVDKAMGKILPLFVNSSEARGLLDLKRVVRNIFTFTGVKQFMCAQNLFETKMHSRGMRTARLLTVSQHALGRGCVSQHALGRRCLPRRGVSVQEGGICPGGGWLPGGCLPCELNDRQVYKHYLAATSLRAVIIVHRCMQGICFHKFRLYT